MKLTEDQAIKRAIKGGLRLMKKLIKRIIERLYYKCYPDRVNDHYIATRSIIPATIPVIHEGREIVKLKAKIDIPQEDIDGDKIPIGWIRKELSFKLEQMIEPEIEIRAERDPLNRQVTYTGFISIVRRRR